MNTRKIERQLYIAQRTMGDVRAAERGQLPRRIVARHYHRYVLHQLSRSKLWTLR